MNRELGLLIKFTNPEVDRYEPVNTESQEIEWENLLKTSFSVNVDLYFLEKLLTANPEILKNIPKLKNVYDIAQNEFNKTLRTLTIFSDRASEKNINYLIFKTLSPFKCVRDNLDIWIKSKREYDKFLETLGASGFKIAHEHKNSTHLYKEGFATLDFHSNISWNHLGHGGVGPELFDLNKIWDRKGKTNYHDLSLCVPSQEDEILLVLAHAIFQHNYITLGEILFSGEIIRNYEVDYDYILGQSRDYKWNFALVHCLKLIKKFYKNAWEIELDVPCESDGELEMKSFYSFGLSIPFQLFMKKGEANLGENSYLNYLVKMGANLYRYVYHIGLNKSLPFNEYPDYVKN